MLFAVVSVLPAWTGSFVPLAITLLALGAGSGVLDVIVNARVAALEKSGPRLMNLAHAMFSLGLLCGSIATGFARQAGADRRWILGVVSAIVLATAWVNRGFRPSAVRIEVARGLLMRRGLLVLGALCGLAFVIEGGIEQWSSIHLEDTLGASAAVGGLGPGAFAGAMVAGRLLGQAHAHRFTATQLMVSAGAVASSGIALAAGAPGEGVALAGFAITGLGISLAAPTFLGLAPRMAPEAPSTAMSSVTAISYLGFLVSPPAVGVVASVAGLRGGLLVLVAVALTARLVPAWRAGATDPSVGLRE